MGWEKFYRYSFTKTFYVSEIGKNERLFSVTVSSEDSRDLKNFWGLARLGNVQKIGDFNFTVYFDTDFECNDSLTHLKSRKVVKCTPTEFYDICEQVLTLCFSK